MMRRLYPDPATGIPVDQAYAAALGRHREAPWCSLSMVASLDGSTVVDGRSGGLSNELDIAVLAQLRRVADVVVVGAGTVRAEGYGVPSKPGQRVAVVTATGRVDVTSELFRSGAGFVVTTTDTPVPDGVDVLRAGKQKVDLAAMLQRLDEMCDSPRVAQVEGGARLNGAFLDADLLNEINLTTSPLLAGGDGPRLTAGATPHAARYELAQLAVDEQSFLYSRWRRRSTGG